MIRPPLREVATRAGVSEPTVSRVLNGRSGVADTTRQRVIAILAELGFTDVPDEAETKRGVVGIICGELTNPVFPALVHEIVDRLARHGIVATIGIATTDLMPEQRYVEEFLATKVDGLVFVAGRHAEFEGDLSSYESLAASGVPFVLVNGGKTGLDVPHIWCDESRAAEKAVEHLVSLGHTRLGCVLGPRQYISTHRFAAGFERAMTAAGLDFASADIVEGPFTREGGLAGARRLFADGATGVICGNDLIAVGAIGAAMSLALNVPRDVSVVGYDGTELSTTIEPALTTGRQPFVAMGELVADSLVSEILRAHNFRDSYMFTPELVARASTARVNPRVMSGGREPHQAHPLR